MFKIRPEDMKKLGQGYTIQLYHEHTFKGQTVSMMTEAEEIQVYLMEELDNEEESH